VGRGRGRGGGEGKGEGPISLPDEPSDPGLFS
jgi:hypothetical protein